MSSTPPGAEPDEAAAQPAPGETLGSAGRRGARWGLAATIAQQAISVLVTLAMTRLLTPVDFGIVAAALVVVNLIFTFVQGGFGISLVRRDEVDPVIISTTVWTGVGVGVIAAVAAALGSPFATGLLGQPDAGPYLAVLGVYAGLNLATIGHRALLQRELRFAAMYSAEVAWSVTYAAVALGLAVSTDLGAWCMVVGNVVAEAVRGTVIVAASRFRPLMRFDREVFRADLRFNAGYLGTSLSSTLAKNFDNIAVSRLLGAKALGAYYVAFVLPQIVRQRVTFVTTEVLTPLLARTKDAPVRQRGSVATVMQFAFFILTPALVGISVLSSLVVEVAFGASFGAAATPLAWLCGAALAETYCSMCHVVLLAHGRTGVTFRASMVRLVTLAVGTAVVAVDPSLGRMAAAVMVSSVLAATWYHRALADCIGWTAARMVRATWPVASAAGSMVVAVVLARPAVGESFAALPALVTLAFGGAAVYLVSLTVLDRPLLAGQLRQVRGVLLGR